MARDRPRPQAAIWFRPFLVLLAAATALFTASFFADRALLGVGRSPLSLLLSPDGGSAVNTLGSVAEVVAAVLGVAVTVVAIIVELAANRYTARITELFFRDPVNFAVLGFFVLSVVQCMWVILAFEPAFAPRIGTALTMGMMTLSLLALLPYFAYVFAFLTPEAVVDRIRAQANRSIDQLRRIDDAASIGAAQSSAARGIDQLADIAVHSIDGKDRGVSLAAVDALYTLLSHYLEGKGELPPGWFRLSGEVAHNPDFISMSERVLADIGERRLWFEMKVLREYETLYAESLNGAREINYRIAINTRNVAEHALEAGDEEVVDLAVKFFNTYLRATINARDVRTGYNVLYQYRLLAEAALEAGAVERVAEIASYLKYYGQTAFGGKQPFLLEVVAYDLCDLCERAHERGSPAHARLLETVLEVDKEPGTREQEQSLRGVRKAQVKLATGYLTRGDEAAARRIQRDMEGEPAERLASIRDELMAVDSPDFWEVIDRGVNLDYLPPARRARLPDFFRAFDPPGDVAQST